MNDAAFVMRCLASVALGLFALMCGYLALTVPMVAATPPTLFALASGAGCYFVWPKARPKGATA